MLPSVRPVGMVEEETVLLGFEAADQYAVVQWTECHVYDLFL